MNEKPNFTGPSDLPKPENPELINYQQKVFEANPEALHKKSELAILLEAEPFDENRFRNLIEQFNDETEKTKSYEGQYTTIQTIRGKHGQLRVYHFPKPDAVKFGFAHLK
jgi:hypothetical protein